MKKSRHLLAFVMAVLIVCSLFSCALTAAAEPSSEAGDPYYLSENSNVDTIHATTVGALPCIGEAKILVFYTDFKDGSVIWKRTTEQVEDMFFSETAKNDPSLAYSDKDSLRSFYYRSSYGKVDITGTVYEYHSENPYSYYRDKDEIADEIIDYYRDIIDWDEYDANNDGYIDGIYFVGRTSVSWGNNVTSYSNSVGNKKIAKACRIQTEFFSTLCHETCHMFGAPDMYGGVSVNPSGLMMECIMDGDYGDLPSATKFVYGWLDNVRFVSSDNTGSYKLRSYTDHGDALVIYPNGDPTNRNWFFVEYVTNEGNNCVPNYCGVRVWKTQMYLDENYDIIGAKKYCSGMPSSPYEYLEAVHPDGVENYFLQAGQELTPYTYPASSYSDTFERVGGSKYLKDLTFSGISISFENSKDKIATVDVSIAEHPDTSKTANAEIIPLPRSESNAFLDNSDMVSFATLSADAEIRLSDTVTISSETGNVSYPVEVIPQKNHIDLQLGIAPDILAFLKKQNDWTVSVSGLTTYYGADVNIENDDEVFDFSDYPIPLVDCGERTRTPFNMRFEMTTRYFKLSDSKVFTIYFDDTSNSGPKNTLYWGEIDLITKKVDKCALELPDDIDIPSGTLQAHIRVWQDYGKVFVKIGNNICCYSNKELIASYNLSNLPTTVFEINNAYYMTDNQSILFSDDYKKAYRMLFDGEQITVEALDIDLSGIGFIGENWIQSICSYVEGQYIISAGNTVRLVDVVKNTVKDFTIESKNIQRGPRNSIYFRNDKYYVFATNGDLMLYVLDKDLNLLSEKCILKNISESLWAIERIYVDFYNDSWFVYFQSPSYIDEIAFQNMYLLICDEDGELTHYYKYGGKSQYTYLCQFIPLSQNRYAYVSVYYYGLFGSAACREHDFGDWSAETAPTCTALGMEKRVCSICGEVETREVPAKGHSYGEAIFTWSDDGRSCTAERICENDAGHVLSGSAIVTGEVKTPATCTTMGVTVYTARITLDGVEYTDTKEVTDIPAKGHSYGEAVFTWNGYDCSAVTYCSCGDMQSVKCSVTSVVTKEATTRAEGVRTYTATAEVNGQTYTSVKTESIPKANAGNIFTSVINTIRDAIDSVIQTIFSWFKIK